jgi:hypothetical protein
MHFIAHSLNLAISVACKITTIQNYVRNILSIYTFFRTQIDELEFKKNLYKYKILFSLILISNTFYYV